MEYSLPKSDYLQIERLGHIFDDKSECYKLFWFQVILRKIVDGQTSATYEEIINEMIADAWYMVSEYHLNLGPRDNLERAVTRLSEISNLKPAEKKSVLMDYISVCKDSIVMSQKRALKDEVPYRLQAPFLDGLRNDDLSKGRGQLIGRLNEYKNLIYYYDPLHGLQTRIHFEERWCAYFKQNYEIIRGWLSYKLVEYLQRRNPNVPGVIDKLYPPQERDLHDIQKYWRMIIGLQPIYEIYGGMLLEKKDLSIDHFVPWSYVANDEIWNLHPTTRSINSAKSNNLPDWEEYFQPFSKLEYQSYCLAQKYEPIHKAFDECKKKHLNSETVAGRLYAPGLTEKEFQNRLSEVVLPVFQSAKAVGFQEWTYEKKAV